MIDYEMIRRTMRERLLSVEGINKTIVAFENVSFKPPNTGFWIRETLLTNDEHHVAQAVLEGKGFAQYDVLCRAGGGTEDAALVRKRIGDAFPPASSIVGETTVQIIRSTPLPGAKADATWFMLPIRVEWRCHEPTPSVEE